MVAPLNHFISNRCHCCFAVATPVTYEWIWIMAYVFTKLKNMRKLWNIGNQQSTSHPWLDFMCIFMINRKWDHKIRQYYDHPSKLQWGHNELAAQITSLMIVYSNVYSGADQRKHQSSAALAFVWGIHRWPVNSLHKGPVTWKMFPFDDVIIISVYQN